MVDLVAIRRECGSGAINSPFLRRLAAMVDGKRERRAKRATVNDEKNGTMVVEEVRREKSCWGSCALVWGYLVPAQGLSRIATVISHVGYKIKFGV